MAVRSFSEVWPGPGNWDGDFEDQDPASPMSGARAEVRMKGDAEGERHIRGYINKSKIS